MPEVLTAFAARHSPSRALGESRSLGHDPSALPSLVTYIIAEPCIDLKDRSCVDVCPVDCIHEAERILVIDPEECIDCGACEPECPVEAIFPEDALPARWEPLVRINYAYGDGITAVNRLVSTYRNDDSDGDAGVREPRRPPPETPGGSGTADPGR